MIFPVGNYFAVLAPIVKFIGCRLRRGECIFCTQTKNCVLGWKAVRSTDHLSGKKQNHKKCRLL